jgi:hypothetical protein
MDIETGLTGIEDINNTSSIKYSIPEPNIEKINTTPINHIEKTQKKKLLKKKKSSNEEKKPRASYYYHIDISDIPSYINNVIKFMNIHPEFFKTNVSKKMVYLHENQIYHIYSDPVIFKDSIHGVKGYITTTFDQSKKQYNMIISIKLYTKVNSAQECYAKQIEEYVSNQLKHGDQVELHYNKILNDTMIKHCYYNHTMKQWAEDVQILKDEFFIPNKKNLLAIMDNKISNFKIGSMSNSWNNLILEGSPGTGKCLGINTPILMYDGTIKNVQDVKVGDLVMGDDSNPRTVLSLATGRSVMYKIICHEINESYIVNKDHILSLIYHNDDNEDSGDNNDYANTYDCCEKVDMPVEEYIKMPEKMKNLLHGYYTGVTFNSPDLIDTSYEEIIDNIGDIESIPLKFKISNRKNRAELLNQIIKKYNIESIDGRCDNSTVDEQSNIESDDEESDEIVILENHPHEQFKNDVIFIARSLGIYAYKSDNGIHMFNPTNEMYSTGYINFNIGDGNFSAPMATPTRIHNISVEKLEEDNYYGFELDGNHRFVMGNFIVTHNSSYIHRISMMLKKSILSIDLSLYLNKKKELYALLHGQEFSLPNSEEKQPAMTNVIIALEEFDNAIERILDIENIFEYKDVLKRNYLDMKNMELKKKSSAMIKEYNNKKNDLKAIMKAEKKKKIKKPEYDENGYVIDQNQDAIPIVHTPGQSAAFDDYEDMMAKLTMEAAGIDTKNNKLMDKARDEIYESRAHENEMSSINAELDKIIKSMDNDNKSNILRMHDLLELFSPSAPVNGRIIIATTNHLEKIKSRIPALFRAGRMTVVPFSYLDWNSVNELTQYYFGAELKSAPFEIKIPTSEIVELAIEHKVSGNDIDKFEQQLIQRCL